MALIRELVQLEYRSFLDAGEPEERQSNSRSGHPEATRETRVCKVIDMGEQLAVEGVLVEDRQVCAFAKSLT